MSSCSLPLLELVLSEPHVNKGGNISQPETYQEDMRSELCYIDELYHSYLLGAYD